MNLNSYHPSNTMIAYTCNTLQHTATHCNTLQHTATHCHIATEMNAYIRKRAVKIHCVFLHCVYKRCVSKHESASHCVFDRFLSLSSSSKCYIYKCIHVDTYYNVTHYNTLQTHCNSLQHTATYCNTLQHTATYCNTLQYTATHCNTVQHTELK